MDKLKDLVRQAKEYDGRKLFADGDVGVWSPGYIDNRTVIDKQLNIPIVKPVTYEGGFFHYICPKCTDIHFVHRVKIKRGKPIKTGCCAQGKRSSRLCVIGGQLAEVKDQRIILEIK